MYADTVLGYFDTEDEIMRIIVDERGFGLNAEATLAHEFTHALQQIHYDIDTLSDDLEGNSDAQRALRALIEGDAQISELLYLLTYFSEEQYEKVRAESGSGDMSAFFAAPVVHAAHDILPVRGGLQLRRGTLPQKRRFHAG